MTEPDPSQRLTTCTHAVLLAWTGEGGQRRLLVTASPAWSDGAHVWLVAAELEPTFLGPGAAAVLSAPSRPLSLATGTVRAYGLHDPVQLALHGAAVATALGALALRAASAVRRALPGRDPRRPVAVRLQVDGSATWRHGGADDDVAPALPTAVPAEVRRSLAGVRDIVITRPRHAGLAPARWGGGMAIAGSQEPGRLAAIAVASDGTTGLALEGDLRDGRLSPHRAIWWRDGVTGESPVASAATTFVMPQ